MSLRDKSIWPPEVKAPHRRLLIGIFVAPLIIAAILTGAAFLIAGMSEPDRESALAVTRDAGVALLILSYVYALSLGIVGILVLWWLEQRGAVAWAVAGALTGAIAGLVFGEVLMGGVDRAMLLAYALGGWAFMIIVRWIAGVRPDPEES
jgi:hypothetical protein